MRKVLRITLYTLGSLLLLLVFAVIFINSRWGQDFIRGRAEAFLRNKLKTEVHIGHLGYGFPKYVVINDALFLDQSRDTLLSLNTLKVDLNMLQLMRSKINIQQVIVNGLHSHIYRAAPDTAFNFTYIINAFTGNSNADANTTDTSAPLDFTLDRVNLNDIHARFDDTAGGMKLALDLDHLNLSMQKLDVDNMLFHVKDLSVSGLRTEFDQDTSYLPATPVDTAKSRIKVIADNVDLQRIAFRYNNYLNKFLFALQLGGLQLQLNKYDRDYNRVDLKKLAISNSTAELIIGKSTTAPAPIDTIVKIDTTEGWDVKAGEIDLSGLNLKMDNENEPKLAYGLDYNHLDVKDLMLNMADLRYADDVSGDLRHFSATDKSGLQVRELKTTFRYYDEGLVLNNLLLQTPNTVLQDHFEMHYPSLEALTKNLQSLSLKMDIEKSIVGLYDIGLVVPEMRKQQLFRKYEKGHLRVDAIAAGSMADLGITRFYLQGLNNTEIQLSGNVGGIPDMNRLHYKLNIARFNSSREDILALTPPNAIPASFRIPDRFGAAGTLSGNTKDVAAHLALASSDGAAYVNGTVATSPGKGHEKYDLEIKTMQLNLGHIMKQDSMVGPITANVYVKGYGFDPKTMSATANGNISSALLYGYRYHDVTFEGNAYHQVANATFAVADANLRVQGSGTANFSNQYPSVLADVRIDSIDLQALHLYTGVLRARGRIHMDFTELNPDYPDGALTWYQPVILVSGKRYFSDSFYVISRPSADTGQNIFASVGFADARITGKTPLTKIGYIVQDHINRHYSSAQTDSAVIDITRIGRKNKDDAPKTSKTLTPTDTTIPASYDLAFQAHVYDKPILHSLLPGLESFDSIHVDGTLSPRTLTLNANTPELVYNSLTIENARAQIRGSDSALTYRITVDQVTQSQYGLYYADINGGLDRNVLTANVSLSDAAKKERFAMKASMFTSGSTQTIQLQPGLKLNYAQWEVNPANKIVLEPRGFFVQNFGISNNDQYIRANSDQPRPNTPIKIAIANFRLANLTDIASKNDTLIANGILSGNITIEQMLPVTKATGDLQVQNLSIFGDTVGNLQAQVTNRVDDRLDTKMTLSGQGNDIALNGYYSLRANDPNTFNFDININALSLRSFEGVTMHQVSNSSGFIRGNLAVRGSMDKPNITGELRTDNLKTTVAQLNTDFRMPAEKILFAGDRISFDRFTLQDSAGNKATVDGSINIEELTDPAMNLTITADHWRAIHSTPAQNKEMYGDLILSTRLKINGSLTTPSVEGSVNVLDGTKLTVANPEKKTVLQSTKGIVVFVNMRDSSWGKALMPRRADTIKAKKRLAAGSDINVNITIEKNAEFSLIIDQASGDFVNVRGDAYFNTSVSSGGVFQVTGSYLLHSGTYQMNYNFIRRRFIIKDGSTIMFGGDPTKNTMLNIDATYQTNTPAYDLVMRQVPDPAQLNYYRQSLPFNVDLHLKGNMMQPAFSFDITLPEDKIYPLSTDQIALIEAKLNQVRLDTNELNKQVFAVLILGRFVSDDPFTSNTAQGIGFTAIQSVSTFIGEQLNQAAGKLIKGVDLTVDLATTEDYTTGQMRQRTDLSVAASKRVLNDRLKLTVGNDFEVEGPQPTNSGQGLVPSNLAADYMLSADGRYTVRAYRRNYNEGALQGYVTETGVNFIVNVDYNRFKTVFMKTKKRKARINRGNNVSQ